MTEHGLLSLQARMLLTQWTLAWMAERDGAIRNNTMLQGRMLMPSGHEVDMATYRAHVREVLAHRNDAEALRQATEAEILLFLEHLDVPLNAEAFALYQALIERVRERLDRPLPQSELLTSLRQKARVRPVDRALRSQVSKEERQWTDASNGQAA